MFKNPLVKGTFILTAAGLTTRFMGFFFRIYLSHTFGEEQVGLYQLIFPVYALCISLTSAGIETSLSRCVAKYVSLGQKKKAHTLLCQALMLSLLSSLTLGFFLRKYAPVLALSVLGDRRCETLLLIVSYALPLSSVHSCIIGYFLGVKDTKPAALSQFFEQLIRIASVFVLYPLCPTIEVAIIGIVAGEFISALFSVRAYFSRLDSPALGEMFGQSRKLHSKDYPQLWSLFKELSAMALPLTAGRVLMALLQSAESISIPLSLQAFGLSASEALSTYGVLTGMALPCILFPSAITNSISLMLLPTVAEMQVKDTSGNLKSLIKKVLSLSAALGIGCSLIFLIFGSLTGKLLFHSNLAGSFLQTLAWICPFLYLNTTLISILNGLGKAGSAFLIHTLSLAVRICGVWLGIPKFGMEGYLWGLLLSQFLLTICGLLLLVNSLGQSHD